MTKSKLKNSHYEINFQHHADFSIHVIYLYHRCRALRTPDARTSLEQCASRFTVYVSGKIRFRLCTFLADDTSRHGFAVYCRVGDKLENRTEKSLLVSFAGYVLVLIITAIYFVPELLSIIGTPYSEQIDEALTQRAVTWEKLSIIRMIFMMGLSATMLSSLMWSDRKTPEPVMQRGKVFI